MIRGFAGRNACLLSNHGVITLGEEIKSAFNLAIEIEEIAKQYLLSVLAGKPVLLDEKEMQVNLDKFKNYGKQI